MAKSVISASVVKIVKLALLCKLGTYGRLVYMKIELYALHRTAILNFKIAKIAKDADLF